MNCPIYQAQLKHDIEHIDEIEDVTWRCALKRKFKIELNNKDKQELQQRINDFNKIKKILDYDINKTLI